MKLKKIYLTKERCEIYINTLKSINELLILSNDIEDEYLKKFYIIFQHNITNLLAKINNDDYHSNFDFEFDNSYKDKEIFTNIDFFKKHCIYIPMQKFLKNKNIDSIMSFNGRDIFSYEIENNIEIQWFINFIQHINNFDTLICSLLYTFDYWKKLKKKKSLVHYLEFALLRLKASPIKIQFAALELFKKEYTPYNISSFLYMLSTKDTLPCEASVFLNKNSFNIIYIILVLEQIEKYHGNLSKRNFLELTTYLNKLRNISLNELTYIYEKYPYTSYRIILAASTKYSIILNEDKKQLVITFLPYLKTLTDKQFFDLIKNIKNEYFMDIYEELRKRKDSSADEYIGNLVLTSLKES